VSVNRRDVGFALATPYQYTPRRGVRASRSGEGPLTVARTLLLELASVSVSHAPFGKVTVAVAVPSPSSLRYACQRRPGVSAPFTSVFSARGACSGVPGATAESARSASTSPWSSAASGSVPLVSAWTIWSRRASGRSDRASATSPETIGAADDVPQKSW
jgi:hypothetical protein